jgi:exopolysaccharide production protein ExoQ
MKVSNKLALTYMKIYIILIIVFSSQCLAGYEIAFGKIVSYTFYLIFFIGMFFIYIYLLYIILYYRKFYIIKHNITLIFLLLFLFFISILGSADVIGSFLNLIFFTGLILYSIILVYYYSQNEIVDVILEGCLLVIILNIIFIIIFPQYSYGMDDRFNAIKGSFVHRNVLAAFMSLSCIFSFISFISKDYKRKILALVCFVLSLILLLVAQSSTSLVCFLITITIILLIRKFSIKFNVVSILLLIQAAFYTLINYNNTFLYNIFINLGRDPTLTGRTFIWSKELMAVSLRPLLGYGYGVIWTNKSLTDFLYYEAGFDYGQGAHSGILELLLEIGIIGSIVFILIIIIIPSYKLIKTKSNSVLKYLATSTFIYILIYTLTEKSFSSKDFQTFFLLIFIVFINKTSSIQES